MKWQYTAVQTTVYFDDEEKFCILGNKGWELVGFNDGKAWFKRPIKEDNLSVAIVIDSKYKSQLPAINEAIRELEETYKA